MGRLARFYGIGVRPQLAVILLASAVTSAGQVITPELVRPARADYVPVIQPVINQVSGATVDREVDCSAVACLALTFDDGPKAEVTTRVLDILDAHYAKATFFVIGRRVPGNEALLRRMHAGGHEIGNHTWSHRKISDLSPQELQDDIARAQEVITAAGVPTPRLFRPPYGLFNPMIRSHVSMTVVSWNIDPEDWRAKKPEQIVEHVLAHARPGAIVDLHDVEQITADALGPILTALEQQYRLVTVTELLNLSPGQPGIFYSR